VRVVGYLKRNLRNLNFLEKKEKLLNAISAISLNHWY